MKNSILLITCLFFSFNNLAQTCPGDTITYTNQVVEGVLVIPESANYDTGSAPWYEKVGGIFGGSLRVKWDRAGNGTITALTYDGENFGGTSFPVIIGSQPTFTTFVTTLCNDQTATFTVSDVCGTSYYWSAPAGWSINGGSNTLATSSKSVNITAPSTGTGNNTISVTSNNNISGSIYANILLGPPSSFGVININNPNPGNFLTSQFYEFTTSNYPYPPSASWSVQGGTVIYNGGSVIQVEFTVYNDYAYITASNFTNDCGTVYSSIMESFFVMQGDCPPGDICSNVVFPNPATESLTIGLSQEKNERARIELYNNFGKMVDNFASHPGAKSITIPVNHLNAGQYIVRILSGNKIITRHVVVNH